MMALTQWSPFSPFQLRREVDDVFGRFFATPERGQGNGTATWWPEVEGKLEEGQYLIRMALPGVDPKNVEVTFEKNLLTVKGERKAQTESKQGGYFIRELSYGGFERTFALPEGVDGTKVNAKFVNGMLEIRVPGPVAQAPKRVEIQLEGTETGMKSAA